MTETDTQGVDTQKIAMDWDKMTAQGEEEDRDRLIDTGNPGVIDLGRLSARDSHGHFRPKIDQAAYMKRVTGQAESIPAAMENLVGDSAEKKYAGMSDAEISKQVFAQAKKNKDMRVHKPTQRVREDFKSRFDKNYEWLPHYSLYAQNLSRARRGKTWVVKALILIRDDGRCRICGERVRGNTWKMLKEDKRGGVEENNCFLACKECGMCHEYRQTVGHDRLGLFKAMKLFVLKRRNKGVKGCKPLNEEGGTTLAMLRRELETRSFGSIDCNLVKQNVGLEMKEKNKVRY